MATGLIKFYRNQLQGKINQAKPGRLFIFPDLYSGYGFNLFSRLYFYLIPDRIVSSQRRHL